MYVLLLISCSLHNSSFSAWLLLQVIFKRISSLVISNNEKIFSLKSLRTPGSNVPCRVSIVKPFCARMLSYNGRGLEPDILKVSLKAKRIVVLNKNAGKTCVWIILPTCLQQADGVLKIFAKKAKFNKFTLLRRNLRLQLQFTSSSRPATFYYIAHHKFLNIEKHQSIMTLQSPNFVNSKLEISVAWQTAEFPAMNCWRQQLRNLFAGQNPQCKNNH